MKPPISIDQMMTEPAREFCHELEREEICQRVRARLSELPQHERQALEAWSGLTDESCRDVAKRYRVSPQSACNWAQRARQRLRPQLEGCR